MWLSEKDLFKMLLTSNINFYLKWAYTAMRWSRKAANIFYVCMLIVFPHESNRAKKKQKGILYFSIILGVQEEEYDKVHTIDYRTCNLE